MPIGSSTPTASPSSTPSAASERANSKVASANCSNVRRTPPKTSASDSGHSAAARSTWSARVQQALYGSGRLIGLHAQPDDVEARAEAPQGSDQRRPEREVEEHVARRVGDVERQRGAVVGDQPRRRVVPERDPAVEVHDRAEPEAGEPAGGGERDPRELPAEDPRQAGPEQPDAAPGDHLPRRPRSLPEEEVAGQRR